MTAMARILNLETATTNCSVSISENEKTIYIKENNAVDYSHSEQLHVFIQQIMGEAFMTFSDLDAVAVSKGPGSYTGLRIGVSAAKGLCFSLNLPLIAIPTLQSMARQVDTKKGEVIVPVLDARRMEIYSAVYDHQHEEIRETRAEIINGGSFSEFMDFPKIHLVGNGAAKCMEVIRRANFVFDTTLMPSAKEMGIFAFRKFQQGLFEDIAYFEPFYLKDFVLQGKKT